MFLSSKPRLSENGYHVCSNTIVLHISSNLLNSKDLTALLFKKKQTKHPLLLMRISLKEKTFERSTNTSITIFYRLKKKRKMAIKRAHIRWRIAFHTVTMLISLSIRIGTQSRPTVCLNGLLLVSVKSLDCENI